MKKLRTIFCIYLFSIFDADDRDSRKHTSHQQDLTNAGISWIPIHVVGLAEIPN
jgi:hypothetical protein